jgi:hypothetical protein
LRNCRFSEQRRQNYIQISLQNHRLSERYRQIETETHQNKT